MAFFKNGINLQSSSKQDESTLESGKGDLEKLTDSAHEHGRFECISKYKSRVYICNV